jgi:hypothetical protein
MDRPIIFSAPMVRALLDGRKTQTRRVLKPQPLWEDAGHTPGGFSYGAGWSWTGLSCWADAAAFGEQAADFVRIRPGDRLWVREAFQEFLASEFPPGRAFGPRGDFGIPAESAKGNVSYVAYRAEGDFPPHPEDGKAAWRSPTHMPRKYSRLTLTVADVRVQRLQDISEQDALAEGADAVDRQFDHRLSNAHKIDLAGTFSHVLGYERLWDSINGAGSWEANPWIAAYTFTVERRNIDASLPMLAERG